MRRIWVVLAATAIAACVRVSEPGRRLGDVDFPVSCSEPARHRVDEGVALLHHQMHDLAERSFFAATAVDEKCAMAHWGIAMAQIRPLWAGHPGEAALEKGSAAIARARALAPPTQREAAYVEATAAYFEDWARTGDATRIARWRDAAERVHRADPDDVDAAAFHALAILASALGDPTLERQKAAAAILEPLRREHPGHPGLANYLIHACDNHEMAERGLETARDYPEIAPDLPAAAHTSTHVFLRLGRWDEAATANLRALPAVRRAGTAGAAPTLYAHVADYLMYSYLQAGWDVRAGALLRQLSRIERFDDDFASAYALAAVSARFSLERRDWAGAATVTPAGPADFPWGRYPVARAVTQFARGLGAARGGDAAAGRAAVAALDAIVSEIDPAESIWVTRVQAERLAVAAWCARAAGDTEKALESMRVAADLEDSVAEDPFTPGPVLRLRDLLGDMLLEAGRPADGLREFEASLAAAPRRLYAVAQAGRAARKADEVERAREHYLDLLRLVEKSRCRRPEIAKAKAFLRANPEAGVGG